MSNIILPEILLYYWWSAPLNFSLWWYYKNKKFQIDYSHRKHKARLTKRFYLEESFDTKKWTSYPDSLKLKILLHPEPKKENNNASNKTTALNKDTPDQPIVNFNMSNETGRRSYFEHPLSRRKAGHSEI